MDAERAGSCLQLLADVNSVPHPVSLGMVVPCEDVCPLRTEASRARCAWQPPEKVPSGQRAEPRALLVWVGGLASPGPPQNKER